MPFVALTAAVAQSKDDSSLSQYGLKTIWVEKGAVLHTAPLKSVNDAAYLRFLAKLRAARAEANISQEELARRLSKHQTYVSKIERGERLLDLMEFLYWARGLEMDPLALLAGFATEIQTRRIRNRAKP